jgi:hypothetical protein
MSFSVFLSKPLKTPLKSKISPLFTAVAAFPPQSPKPLIVTRLGSGKMTGMRVFMGGLEGWGKYEWGNIGGAGLFFAGSFGDFGDGDSTTIEGDFFALARG